MGTVVTLASSNKVIHPDTAIKNAPLHIALEIIIRCVSCCFVLQLVLQQS